LPGSLDNYAPDSDYEYSFVFTLDDLIVDTATRAVTYTAGARAAGTSYTAASGSSALLGDNTGITDGVEIRQFIMPIWGGFDGLDISEKEPFKNANGLAASSQTDLNNAMLYSVNLAIDSIKDNEQVIANTLSIPGVTAPIVTDKIISTCETRKDLLGVIDLEQAFVPNTEGSSEVYYAVSDTINRAKIRKLNSSYACAFHPWVQVQTNTGTASGKLYVPPSVAAIGAFAKSTAQSELWFAPAGFTRGGLSPLGGVGGPRVVNVRDALSSKDRDNLYKININPIASFPGEGIVIFGQKTLQAFPSALDRINVRRLLIFLKHELSNISRRLLFEPNVQTTWNRFKSQADGVLSNVQANLGVTEYKIVLDETTTTADLIDRNILYAKIYIKPTRAIEYIVVDLIVTNTGAEFV
jgi:phage tail sheath protein FI